MVNEIIKQCSDLSLTEIEALRYELLILYRDKFESMYKTVEIYTGERIEEKIKKETGFPCYHKPCEGYSMGRGTHVIVIPIEKYSDDLKTELKSKYDYWCGYIMVHNGECLCSWGLENTALSK